VSVHGDPKNICPYCLKWFATRQGVKAHQKAARHRVKDMEDGAEVRRAAAREDNERRRIARILRRAREAARAKPQRG
jgi:hypothetical protein